MTADPEGDTPHWVMVPGVVLLVLLVLAILLLLIGGHGPGVHAPG